MTFSLAILHSKIRPERVTNLREMLMTLTPLAHKVPLRVFDEPCPPDKLYVHWQHELHPQVWGWALGTGADHHLFMTDDLLVAPEFWQVLEAITTARPEAIVGLMSNSPFGPALYEAGFTGYKTNAWVCGPAYVMPRKHLMAFLPYYLSSRTVFAHRGWGDDMAINWWVTNEGGPGEVYHPIPCPIEHCADLATTTTGEPDANPYERVSWRVFPPPVSLEGISWGSPEYWKSHAPRVRVG